MKSQKSKLEAIKEIKKHAASFAGQFHPVYVALNWEWATFPDGRRVPTWEELRNVVYSSVKSVGKDVEAGIISDNYVISSGGIELGWTRKEELYYPFLRLDTGDNRYDVIPITKNNSDKKAKRERTTIEQDLMEALIK